jgi:serine/threonine-protein kinase RsbW
MILMEQQKIQFPASSENMSLVEKLIDEICNEYKISEDYYGNILISLTEAVNNAIHHGNKSNPEKMVQVCVETISNELCFTVKDEGAGFDYQNLPDPTDPELIDKPNGRGVFLMKHLADDIEFKENGSVILLKFKVSEN